MEVSLRREWWGPRFWAILHKLAESSGGQKTKILMNDELNAWDIVLKLYMVLPCKVCKEHYMEWKIKHPINLHADDRREMLRTWIWTCHNNTNTLLSKTCIPIEDLINYKKKQVDVEFKELSEMFKIAVQRNLLKFEDCNRWKAAVNRLRALYA